MDSMEEVKTQKEGFAITSSAPFWMWPHQIDKMEASRYVDAYAGHKIFPGSPLAAAMMNATKVEEERDALKAELDSLKARFESAKSFLQNIARGCKDSLHAVSGKGGLYYDAEDMEQANACFGAVAIDAPRTVSLEYMAACLKQARRRERENIFSKRKRSQKK